MLIKTTIPDIIKNIAEGPAKIINNSCNGKCSCCGECCTPFLPITQEELDIIQKYVILNNIEPQSYMLVMQNRLTCPYHNGKKCLIYEVRPLICREFYCYKRPSLDGAKKLTKNKRIPVDFWAIAKEIEKERIKFYAKNKHIRNKRII